MGNSLEERLQEHSNAFNGLLSLIPAKYYYDEDTTNQWQQKRKSKEEHSLNKKKKLNPENNKNVSARDVLNETEKTATPVVLPGEKLRELLRRQAEADEAGEDDEEDDDNDDEDEDEEEEEDEDEESGDSNEDSEKLIQENVTIVFDDNGDTVTEEAEYKKAEVQKNAKAQKGKKVLTKEEQEEKERKYKELKAKLQAKIQSMREKRKAPGSKVPGAATSRQQILEERRRKAELKKEMKKKTVEEESSDDEVSDLSDVENIDESTSKKDVNVMFGNIEFADGERVSSDLSTTRRVEKKKGPSNNDIKGHLKKIEREKERLQDLDKDSKSKIEDKQKWQKALASVQGLKVKDDEKLLKKALRRKESIKRKSEREWKDRIQTVADEKKMKSDRRDENLRIRRENKGKDRKHQVKQLPSYKRSRAHKKLAGTKRAGFEGGIRSKTKK